MNPPTEAQHTPVPWAASVCRDERHHSHSIMSVELSRKMDAGEPASHPLLASVRFGNGHVSAREAEANARFIVTACNSHTSLLSACEAAEKALRSYQYGNSSTHLAEEVANHLRTAIASARKEQS